MGKRIAIGAAALVAVLGTAVGALYLTLVLDWFTPRSDAKGEIIAAQNYSLLTADLTSIGEAVKKKYGPQARAVFNSDTGLTVEVDGKVVEAPAMPTRVIEVFGAVRIKDQAGDQLFPFISTLDESQREQRRPIDIAFFRKRFARSAADGFDITEQDWQLGGCRTQTTALPGGERVAETLKLKQSDVCEIRWLARAPETMLIGGAVAEGGTWVRHFSRRICRTLAEDWVRAGPVQAGGKRPGYVTCFLVHDPNHAISGIERIMRQHVYQIRDDALLALID
jgi:hypothetical protein